MQDSRCHCNGWLHDDRGTTPDRLLSAQVTSMECSWSHCEDWSSEPLNFDDQHGTHWRAEREDGD